MPPKDEVPGSVRIRTNDGNSWRYDCIMRATKLYDCNRSDAVAYAAHDIPGVVKALRRVLGRDDLTGVQKREIAETLNGNVRGVEFDVSESVTVETQD